MSMLLAIVIAEGFVILSIEVSIIRLLMPYLGSGVEVTSILITAIFFINKDRDSTKTINVIIIFSVIAFFFNQLLTANQIFIFSLILLLKNLSINLINPFLIQLHFNVINLIMIYMNLSFITI